MDFADQLDMMDDDCDIEGFPLAEVDDSDEIENKILQQHKQHEQIYSKKIPKWQKTKRK